MQSGDRAWSGDRVIGFGTVIDFKHLIVAVSGDHSVRKQLRLKECSIVGMVSVWKPFSHEYTRMNTNQKPFRFGLVDCTIGFAHVLSIQPAESFG
jgi:hypothetical protein